MMSNEGWSSGYESAKNISRIVNTTNLDAIKKQQTLKEKRQRC